MNKRYMTIWFPHLTTDWMTLRHPALREWPFVFAAPQHGRMVVTAANPIAEAQGIAEGMVVADAKAFITGLQVFDHKPALAGKLLKAFGLWCIRYTPTVSIAGSDGLILDISGCAHLWGGEQAYFREMVERLNSKGYTIRAAIADTIGAAWAMARYGKADPILESSAQLHALLPLPPAALRLPPDTVQRLHKLGLRTIGSFIGMPPSVLRRRFGEGLLLKLRQAAGQEDEYLHPLQPVMPYEERLPCLDPIRTATGIEIALQQLLEALCKRLSKEGVGVREAVLTGYRIDGKTAQVTIGTSQATASVRHIRRLFELKIPQIEPALGIELFVLQATKVADTNSVQESLWNNAPGLEDTALAELLDRLRGKVDTCTVSRYLPDEHHWPERSFKRASAIGEKPAIGWRHDKPRPIRLLTKPEPIEVSAPIPDYPPMTFRYKSTVHHVKKADGPERIAREWWMDEGEHRDYYHVEDEQGRRYWLFRSGHYQEGSPQRWFIHGFFA
ncbi:Y-family DNA polymerase [Parapedobacter sp. DT-150]|uniref:Y-family DNA polymerase n=1 Tax=Parapedobacter sp. DT-150 TaxID=3396162 RepID=UPI003F541EB2